MKVLVLGGTRYMGRAATMNLLAAGHEVVSVSRTPSDGAIRHLVCDRKDHSTLEALLREEAPEAILDMVCFDAHDGAGMARLFESGALCSLEHYLMVSTFFPYNYFDGREAPFTGDPAAISDGYTRRKVEAEAKIQAGTLFAKSSILRLPFVFSHDDYTGRFQQFCVMARDGRVTAADKPAWKTSMIGMEDAGQSLSKILQGPPLGYVDAANAGCLSLHEIATTVAKALGVSSEFHGTDDPGAIYALRRDLCLDSEKAPKLRPLPEALTDEAQKWSDSLAN
ncbi:MAG: NAD-dependent epimerase/dehydratase family protein [Gallionellaceae bacterium]|nr:NAD-dependent epimerase/dehydratase family protein [Gallionellaceae bacterium]